MKKYTIEVVIYEGCDEFWADATKGGMSGCDSVILEFQEMLRERGYDDADIKLTKFEDSQK